MKYAAILLQVLDLAAVSALTAERAIAVRDRVKAIIEEGRDPTTEEWDALRAEGLDLDARLDAAADRLTD